MKNQNPSKLMAAAVIVVFLFAAGAASAQNIVKNGGFENPPVAVSNGQPYFTYGARWNAFPSNFSDDLGWTVEWRADVKEWLTNFFVGDQKLAAAPPAFLELQTNGVYSSDSNADTGLQWAELDSDWSGPFDPAAAPDPPHRNGVPFTSTEVTSTSIHQVLETLPGAYELSFALAARPGTGTSNGTDFQNRLEVMWNGQRLFFAGVPYVQAIAAANITDPMIWTKYTAVVEATGLETELRFTDLGYADSFGTFLDSVVVTPFGDGCTKTQGYWKTHSIHGPASSVDPTWAKAGEKGADTPFLSSGLTWYEVLSTSPKGNAWFVLAHQYIAAELNRMSGSSLYKNISYNDLYNAMSQARALLNVLPSSVDKRDGQAYVDIAYFLSKYNEGIIGPGHCYEEAAQAPTSSGTDGNSRNNGRSSR